MANKDVFSFVIEPLIIQCLEQPIWEESIEQVLTAPQKALLETSLAGWRKREKRRICYYTMLYLNNQQQVLSYETQVAVSEMLVDKAKFSMKGDGMLNLLGSITKLPEKDWQSVIPAEKWPSFSMMLKELSKMVPDKPVEPENQ